MTHNFKELWKKINEKNYEQIFFDEFMVICDSYSADPQLKQIIVTQLALKFEEVKEEEVTDDSSMLQKIKNRLFDVWIDCLIVCKAYTQIAEYFSEAISIQPLFQQKDEVRVMRMTSYTGGRMSLTWNPFNVAASPRKLRARLNGTDGLNTYEYNEEWYQDCTEELVKDITSEFTEYMHRIAHTVKQFDPHPGGIHSYEQDLLINLRQVSHGIAHLTRRGVANTIYVNNSEDYNLITTSPVFQGQFKNVRQTDFHREPNDRLIILAYGNTDYVPTLQAGINDVGIVWCPLFLLMSSGFVVDPMTFQPCQAFFTRYAVFTDDQSKKYYGVLNIK